MLFRLVRIIFSCLDLQQQYSRMNDQNEQDKLLNGLAFQSEELSSQRPARVVGALFLSKFLLKIRIISETARLL